MSVHEKALVHSALVRTALWRLEKTLVKAREAAVGEGQSAIVTAIDAMAGKVAEAHGEGSSLAALIGSITGQGPEVYSGGQDKPPGGGDGGVG